MRLVRWESQERVDLPDMTALSFLVLGEFRRTMREFIVGLPVGGNEKFIIRGFEVEPSAVPDTRIRVRADDGVADRLGAAILAENLGSFTEDGQLVGGTDSAGALEGQAQQIIDFTGQPAATYIVEVRFTYGQGANDNRAFWNPGVNSEFIASMDTRHEPQWQIQIVGAATGGEWLPIGSVVWDGVGPITTSEITDTRPFVFEGTAGSFEEAAQTTASTSAPDFSRLATRGVKTVTVDTIVKMCQALARQVRDLKGADDNNMWNWWNYPFKPLDPTDLLTAGQTKNLRSVDTVTFTVGDGATAWGDFNGATGLQDCLDHIVAIPAANRPGRIRIVLKTDDPNAFTWTITDTTYVFSTASNFTAVEIIGGGADGSGTGTARAEVSVSIAASAQTVFAASEFVLRNVQFTLTGAGTTNRFFTAERMHIENSRILGDTATNAEFTLRMIDDRRTRIINSQIEGRVLIYRDGASPGGTLHDSQEVSLFANSEFTECQIRTSPTAAGDHSMGSLSIVDCRIVGRAAAPYTGSPACVYLQGAQNVLVEGCRITHHADEDGIRAENYVGSVNTMPPFHVVIRRNVVLMDGTATHASGAGTNGANGTGWNVYCEDALDVEIDNNEFGGIQFVDAGCVGLVDPQWFSVNRNLMRGLEHTNAASARVTGIFVDTTNANTNRFCEITNNRITAFAGGATTRDYRGIRMDDVFGCLVSGNNIDGGGSIMSATDAGCLVMIDCQHVRVMGNFFSEWNTDQTQSRTVRIQGLSSYLSFVGNTFNNNGGYSINAEGTAANFMTFGSNIVRSANANNEGFSLDPATAATNCTFVGNTFDFSATADAIHIGGSNGFTLMGNSSDLGEIRRTGTPTGAGYNETQDTNDVAGYV